MAKEERHYADLSCCSDAERSCHEDCLAKLAELTAVVLRPKLGPQDDPTLVAHVQNVHLLVPQDVPVTQQIVDECLRLGAGDIVRPSVGMSLTRTHNRAKDWHESRGEEVSFPCLVVEEVIERTSYQTVSTHVLVGGKTSELTDEWAEFGAAILDPFGTGSEEAFVQFSTELHGTATARFLRSGIEVATAELSSPDGPSIASAVFPVLEPGVAAFRVQLQGEGSATLCSFFVVKRVTTREETFSC